MKYKYIFGTISLIMCILFCISCVSAQDVNDTLIINENEIQVSDDLVSSSQDDLLINGEDESNDGELLSTSNDDNYVVSSSKEDSNNDLLGKSGDGTFTQLQEEIDMAPNGATITLQRDYNYNSGFSKEGILIKKNLIINGNGHTLNGMSKSRILNLTFGLKGNNVTLNNIKFINGKTDYYGGAILNYVNLTVNNCIFINNHAGCCGGAINSIGNLKCNGCTFNKNSADGDGGAVFTLSVKNPLNNFMNMYAASPSEGFIGFLISLLTKSNYTFKTDYIKNSVFNSNVAKGRGGGAVYAFSHINIVSCKFNGNKAGQHGGAVFANKNLYIKNSKFYYNKAPKYGGAVYFKCHEQSGSYVNGKWVPKIVYYSNSIETSNFAHNNATKGGAIFGFKYNDKDKVHHAKAIRCTFSENRAKEGRDIYGGNASKCTFNNLKIYLNTVTVKKSANSCVLAAAFKKGSNLVKGKVVSFTFNGKTYKAKTNSKGIAQVIIPKSVLNSLTIGKTIMYKVYYAQVCVKKTAKVEK